MNVYDKGDLVRCSGTFTTSAGVAQDPTVVKAKVKTPGGVTTTYTYGTDAALVKDSTGYHVDVSATESGLWHYSFWSTGTGQAAEEESFYVDESRF